MLHSDVTETLRLAQRFGFFGARPIEEAIEHSMGFVRALEPIDAELRIADIGSGGGLPGLVLGACCPTASITLIDRRQKRTDFLERAVSRLGWSHVAVRCADVSEIIEGVADGQLRPFDVVTARGFGPPELTLRFSAGLITAGGRVVISEPPEGDRWEPELLDELGFTAERHGNVRVFQRSV